MSPYYFESVISLHKNKMAVAIPIDITAGGTQVLGPTDPSSAHTRYQSSWLEHWRLVGGSEFQA